MLYGAAKINKRLINNVITIAYDEAYNILQVSGSDVSGETGTEAIVREAEFHT